jgi:hypothetical protein
MLREKYKDNALQHVNNQYLLKMDFKNFFLSIKPDMFLDCVRKQGLKLSGRDSLVLTNLFF